MRFFVPKEREIRDHEDPGFVQTFRCDSSHRFKRGFLFFCRGEASRHAVRAALFDFVRDTKCGLKSASMDEHIAFCIDALRPIAKELGLDGSAAKPA